jgi:hypothetical protein
LSAPLPNKLQTPCNPYSSAGLAALNNGPLHPSFLFNPTSGTRSSIFTRLQQF